jgi:phosphate transport system ATP-binding protein
MTQLMTPTQEEHKARPTHTKPVIAEIVRDREGGVPEDGNGREKRPPETSVTSPMKAEVRDLSFWYGNFQAVKKLSIRIAHNRITALIGPSGCGKSTLLRCFNRMHDLYPNIRYDGQIVLHPENLNVLGRGVDPIEVRMRLSMVFQKPNPFPKSIFENVAYGLRLRRSCTRKQLAEKVEESLHSAALWDEVKDRLDKPAYALSGGQQQRLCIARALAADPELILFDEPTSALDPIATSKIEELMREVRNRVTIIIVTHNMQQAARLSDFTGFMYLGELVEFDKTEKMFHTPSHKLTEEYVTGRFG